MIKHILITVILIVSSFSVIYGELSGKVKNNDTAIENQDNLYKEVKKDEQKLEFVHVDKEIPLSHRFAHLGLMYAGQWGVYSYTQRETIEEHGSIHSWYSNMTKMHMDKDSYDFNLIQHSYAGNLYYLYYRYWGYSKSSALLWSAMSGLLFEFAIETTTEKPSVQDIYQTPVLGAVMGIGMEIASNYLISREYKILKVLGYILNPFALLPYSSYQYRSIPIVRKNSGGIGLAITF